MAQNISVLLPVYLRDSSDSNRLRKAFKSLASQTCPPREVVICDDSDLDIVPDLLKDIHWSEKTEVKYFKNSKRLGLAGNYNKCIDLSTQTYIHFFAQDEYFINVNGYRNIYNLIKSYPESNWFLIKGINQFENMKNTIDERLLLGINEIGGLSCILAKREFLPKLDPNLTQYVDCDLMFRLSKLYGTAVLHEEATFKYGYGQHQTTQQITERQCVSELRYLIQKHDVSIRKLVTISLSPGPLVQRQLVAQAIKSS